MSGIFASKVVATRPAPRNSQGSGSKLRNRPPRVTPFTSRGVAGTSSFGETPARSSPTAASAGPSSRISKLGGAADAQPAGSSSSHLIRLRTVVLPSEVKVGGGSTSASQVPMPPLLSRRGGSADFSPGASKHSSDLSTRGTGSSCYQHQPPPSSGTIASAMMATLAPTSQQMASSSVSGGLVKSPSFPNFPNGGNLVASCTSLGSSGGHNHGSVEGGGTGVILTTMMSTLNDSVGGEFHSSAHATVPTWDDDTHMLILKVGGTGQGQLRHTWIRGKVTQKGVIITQVIKGGAGSEAGTRVLLRQVASPLLLACAPLIMHPPVSDRPQVLRPGPLDEQP